MDVDAVLERNPDLALVDELAHTNAPGSVRQKRWQDVQILLDAGISVISTVNVQHIESLNDVVEKITGAAQRETVPDSILRGADQVEVVDLAPQALRDRLAEGNVYPLPGSMRPCRTTSASATSRPSGSWPCCGSPTRSTAPSRPTGARRASTASGRPGNASSSPSRAVLRGDPHPEGRADRRPVLRRRTRHRPRHRPGRSPRRPPRALTAQRALTEKLGGTYHQVVGGDVPEALVQFAKAMNASQLVIGVSRRSRIAAALSGPGIGATVIRESGDIDVHIVTHAAAGGRFTLPRAGGALTLRRRLLGGALALVLGPC